MRGVVLLMIGLMLMGMASGSISGSQRYTEPENQDEQAERVCNGLRIHDGYVVYQPIAAIIPGPRHKRYPEFQKCIDTVKQFLTRHSLPLNARLDKVAAQCGYECDPKEFLSLVEMLLSGSWQVSSAMAIAFKATQIMVNCQIPSVDADGKVSFSAEVSCTSESVRLPRPNPNAPLRNRNPDYQFDKMEQTTFKNRKAIFQGMLTFKPASYWEKYGAEGFFSSDSLIYNIWDDVATRPKDYFDKTLAMYESWVNTRSGPEATAERCSAIMVWKIDEFIRYFLYFRNNTKEISQEQFHSLFSALSKTSNFRYSLIFNKLDEFAANTAMQMEDIVKAIPTIR